MSSKNDSSTHPKRRKIDIETKTAIFEQYHKDKSSILSLANHWDVPQATIETIIREGRLPKSNKAARKQNSWYRNQRTAICEMEKLLSIWIEDQMQRNIPISDYDTQFKAAELYDYIKGFYPAIRQRFIANNEWVDWYKERSGYSHIKDGREIHVDSLAEVKYFPETLKALLETESYLPQQVFNVDRMILFWKSMPKGTYNTEEAKEITSDRVTLVLGCNASGDCKLRPFMIYKTDKPRAHTLPVHYQSNVSSWLTATMFEEWFLKHFVPETMSYCQKTDIPFKILLLLDTARRYRKRLVGLHPSIRVVFLPKCSSPQIQPMENGIKSAFKAFYLEHTLNMFSQATQRVQHVTLQELCNVYNIRKCISNIKKAWEGIPQHFLSVAWSRLCPHFVDPNLIFKDNQIYRNLNRQIQSSAQNLGFQMSLSDVENVLQFAGSELSNEALHKLAKLIDEENSETGLNSNPSANSNHSVNAATVFAQPPVYSRKQDVQCDEDLTDNNTVGTDYIKIEIDDIEKAVEPKMHSSTNRSSQEDATNKLSSNQGEHLEEALDIAYMKVEEYPNSPEMTPSVIVDKIELAFDYIACAMEHFKNVDPDDERFESVRSGVNDMLSCYRDICKKNKLDGDR